MSRSRANLTFLLLTGILILPFLGLGEKTASTESVSAPRFVLTAQNDLLSAKIQGVPLKEVLQRLGQLAQIESSLDGSSGNEPVTVEFENLSLEEGIRKILQGKSYALTYTPPSSRRDHTGSPKILGVRVVPKGASPPTGNRTADSGPPSFHPDRTFQAPQSVEARPRGASMTLDSATVPDLQDRDPKVREAVLEQLGGSGDPLPVDSLAEMVQTDTNPVLRMDALELLAEKGGEAALDPLKQALRDPDPAVRGLAQGLIEERRVLAQTVLEQLKVEDP